MRLASASHHAPQVPLSLSVFITIAIFIGASCTQLPDTVEETDDPLASFTIQEGFDISMVAMEPLISDPVDMEIDENGRLFVVEMPGYPLDLGRTGRVKELIDTDGDGLPDESILFADDLVLPTGIMRWKKGFIVTDTPDVLYLEDTNGDGKADKREVLLTGFALSNPQHNMNNPVYGLDNWIYIANEGYFTTTDYKDLFGDEGGPVRFANAPNAPQLPQNAGDRNVRFKPDELQLEMCSASTQFGQAFDPWGHHFETSNFHPLWHEVIAARYLARNPSLLAVDAAQYMPDQPVNEIFPTSQSPEHQLLTDVGVITSGCGINWYTGGLFPSSFNEVLFLCEPVHNLVQANKIRQAGPTYASHPLQEGKEFLSSTDTWFRPSNSYIGPDGALYIIDYHRRIIEHPEWMSDEVNESGQLYEGSDKGRIYRIVPSSAAGMGMDWLQQIDLGSKAPMEWVAYLNHHNSWWRQTAQRLLVNQATPDAELTTAIKEMVKNSEGSPGRIHALWTLEGIGATDAALLSLALTDPVAGVRENAIQLLELHEVEMASLLPDLLALQDDPDPRVRFQLLCTLGFVEGKEAQAAREALLLKDLASDWTHLAALSATPGQEMALFQWAQRRFQSGDIEGGLRFVKNLTALMARKGKESEIAHVINTAATRNSQFATAALQGLATGAKRNQPGQLSKGKSGLQLLSLALGDEAGSSAAALSLLQTWGLPQAAAKLSEASTLAQAKLQTAEVDATQQSHAIQLLSLIDAEAHESLFKAQIAPHVSPVVQSAAINSLKKVAGTENTSFILQKWVELTPKVRAAAVSAFRDYPARMHLLLDEIDEGRIAAQGIGPKQVFEILKNDDKSVRRRATLLFEAQNGDREQVLADYKSVLGQEGSYAKGKMVFEAECATCHQLGGENGYPLGPDLAGIRNRTAESILHDILLPNASIADGYDVWTVETNTAESFSGIIASESPSSMTLRFLDTEDKVLSRDEIKQLKSAPTSLMTTGLEQNIDKEEMGDLLAFLKNRQ